VGRGGESAILTVSSFHYFPDWLPTAAALASDYACTHGLRLGEPFASRVGYAAPAELPDGTPAVLKLNPPRAVESAHEAEALEHYAGRGAVRLLAREGHTLLLERCEPGTPLWDIPEEDAYPIAAGVLERLWRPAPARHPFRTLEEEAVDWTARLEQQPTPEPVVREALRFLCELGPTQGEQVVLHQDLQGSNILASGRDGWLAIDPKPLVGEREFDVASLIRDRRFAFDERLPKRRLDFFAAELGLDRERTRGWAIAHAVAWGSNETMLASARALL
jgi:streptomycin 6-kinase